MTTRKMNNKIYILVPIVNEGKAIKGVINEIKKAGYEHILVVDDGSVDESAKIARDEGAIVLRHCINRGKGAAVKTGIEMAKRLGAEAVVTIDGDGQHNPENAQAMVELLAGGYDVVLGTRMKNPKGMPLYKIVANYIGNLLTLTLYGLWVTDSQSGFRAYSKKALASINTNSDRYEYDSEVIREVKRNKLKFTEVPIEVRYTAYSMGKKEKQGFVNGLKTLIKMILS